MFLTNEMNSFSKGVSYFTYLGELKDFSPCHPVLLLLPSLWLKCITFHLTLLITISIFSRNCNKYLFPDGIDTF